MAARVAFADPTRWSVRPPAPPRAVEALSRNLGVPPTLAALLWSRGLRDDAADHLSPPLALSPNPALPLAAARLAEAVSARRRILIHGDYDADGITGTALLLLGLRELGADVQAFIPNRLSDGYGINPERVAELARRCELLVTVDCGISNLAEVAELGAAGVEVIVTDHHTPGEALPDCLIVHPGLSPLAAGGLPSLTGSGVAFHLLWALRRHLGMEAPLDFADLAAIGTIADVAPLLGENRALIKEGLARIGASRWPGIAATIKQARLNGVVTARDVAFVIAPRLNAAGRLGEAEKGLTLLTTASERQARELAVYLDALNLDRKRVQDEMFEHALGKVDEGAPAVVLEDDSWHVGVMGIVAAKLLERYYRPVYLAASGKGSVRSTPGISAVAGLRAAAPLLKRFGGHEGAAGFGMDMANFTAFREAVYAYVEQFPRPVPGVVADAVVGPGEIDGALYRAIRELEPFGEGHEEPRFALSGRLDSARAVGKNGATLQLWVAGIKGVAWQQGESADRLPVGAAVDVACSIRLVEWQQRSSLEFLAEAVRPAGPLALAPEARGAESQAAALLVTRGPRPAQPQITGFPDGTDAVATLVRQVASGVSFSLELTDSELAALEAEAAGYPTVDELRSGLVSLQRGGRLPFDPLKAERVRSALGELGLLDGNGFVRTYARGEKLSPYASPTLLAGLMRRYQLQTLVHAYRQLDDEAFALSVVRLFGEVAQGEVRSPGVGDGVGYELDAGAGLPQLAEST